MASFAARRGRRTCGASPRASCRRTCAPGASGSGRRAKRPARPRARLLRSRPRPSSALRPSPARSRCNSARSGLSASALAVRSSSQEVTTLPRRQTSAMSARSRSKRCSAGSASEFALRRMSKPFGVGLHEAVLDAVVDHLHEVPGARGAAVEIALLRRALPAFAARRRRRCRRARARASSRSDRAARRLRARRRSSGSSRARAPRRRRSCRRRRR